MGDWMCMNAFSWSVCMRFEIVWLQDFFDDSVDAPTSCNCDGGGGGGNGAGGNNDRGSNPGNWIRLSCYWSIIVSPMVMIPVVQVQASFHLPKCNQPIPISSLQKEMMLQKRTHEPRSWSYLMTAHHTILTLIGYAVGGILSIIVLHCR